MSDVIDRTTYKNIKRMTREQLNAFMLRYRDNILESEENTVDLSELEKELSKISGIGSKRLEEIMGVIENFFNAQ